MPNLEDLLSDVSRNSLIEIKIGSVYRMKLNQEDGVIPKKGDNSRNKYFIVLGIDEENNVIGHVLINSNLNSALPQTLRDLQYPLSCEDYAFLQGQSRYVDCSDLKKMTKTRFYHLYKGVYGEVNEEEIELIKGALKDAKTISPKDLKRFGIQ